MQPLSHHAERSGVTQVHEGRQQVPHLPDMDVGVVEPREQRAAFEVEAAPGREVALQVGALPHRDDAASVDRYGVRRRVG